MTGADLISACAEVVVGDQIREAANCAAGDLDVALDRVREWTAAEAGRDALLIQTARYKAPPLPITDELLGHAADVVGEDEGAVDAIVTQYLRSPEVRDRFDRQLADLATEALQSWARRACEEWRAERR